jgi:DNA-binding winged helix-turn-helix (wHTH) protein
MVPASFTGRVSFGLFVLDGGTRELRRGQEPVHLAPKAFDLLSTLIEQRPRAVSKAALYERLWPNTFVDEANLAILVAEIRAALGDSARKPAFIRTVYGHGYAFSGEAVSVGASSAGPTTTAPTCWLVSKARHVSLHEGENIIGRDPAADVWLDARGISRRHARIVVAGALASVEDAGSKNGTWLKGRRIESAEALKDGDQLKFGSVPMTFRVWLDGGSTDTTGALSR